MPLSVTQLIGLPSRFGWVYNQGKNSPASRFGDMPEEHALTKKGFWQQFEAEKRLLGKQVVKQLAWMKANFPCFEKGEVEGGTPRDVEDAQDGLGYFWALHSHQLPDTEWALVVCLRASASLYDKERLGDHLFIPTVQVIAWRENKSWDSRAREYYDIVHKGNTWEFHPKPDIDPRDLPIHDCTEVLGGYALHRKNRKWVEAQLHRLMLEVMGEVEQSASGEQPYDGHFE